MFFLDAPVAALARGEIVAFPTDTVYGILCDPCRPDAIAKMYAIKGRPQEKPLILLLSSVDDLVAYGCRGNRIAEAAARKFLPGALTLVVARPKQLHPMVTAGRESVGLRVPDHALLQALLTRVGPLASTSANVSGAAAYAGTGPLELPGIDLFVDAGPTVLGQESSVVDFTCDPPVMLREGALAKAAFATWLDNLDVV